MKAAALSSRYVPYAPTLSRWDQRPLIRVFNNANKFTFELVGEDDAEVAGDVSGREPVLRMHPVQNHVSILLPDDKAEDVLTILAGGCLTTSTSPHHCTLAALALRIVLHRAKNIADARGRGCARARRW